MFSILCRYVALALALLLVPSSVAHPGDLQVTTVVFPRGESEGADLVLTAESESLVVAWAASASVQTPVALEVHSLDGVLGEVLRESPSKRSAWISFVLGPEQRVELTAGSESVAEGSAVLHSIVVPLSAELQGAFEGLEKAVRRSKEGAAGGSEEVVADSLRSALDLVGRSDLMGHPDGVRGVGELLEAVDELREALGVRVLMQERLALMERMHEACERLYPPDHPRRSRLTSEFVQGLLGRRRLAPAAGILGAKLEWLEGGDESTLAELQECRHMLGAVLASLGRHLEAAGILEQFLADTERTSGDDHLLTPLKNNLISCLLSVGDSHGALQLCREVLDAYEVAYAGNPVQISVARYSYARALGQTGDMRGAREAMGEVVRVRAEHLESDDTRLLSARDAWASMLAGDDRWDEARQQREEIYSAIASAVPDGNPARTRAYRNLLADRSVAGDVPGVGAELERIAREYSERGVPFEALLTLNHLGWHHVREGDADAARGTAVEIAETLAALSNLLATTLSPREMEAAMGPLEAGLSSALSFGAEESGAVEPAFFTMVESLRAVGLRAARLARMASRGGRAAEERDACIRLSSQLVAAARSGEDSAAQVTLRRQLEGRQRALVAGGAKAGLGANPTPQSIAAELGEGDVLVSYRKYNASLIPADSRLQVSESAFLAFRLTRDARPRLVKLGSALAIEEAAFDWLTAIARDDEALASKRARALARLVIEPLGGLEEAQRLIVVLDDALHGVPFDVLPLGSSLLGDRVRVEVRSSCWEIVNEDPRPERPKVLVAMGDVDYFAGSARPVEGGAPAQLVRAATPAGFMKLPATGEEVVAIGALFDEHVGGEARILRQSDAGRAALLSASDASYLHLATHGFFADPSNADASQLRGLHPMMLSGLALAGANTPQGASGLVEGIVTAQELASIDLEACELVVFSACDTHRGVAATGQGLASLQKAAHMAGARNVVASQWQVEDRAAAELMQAFYRYLWRDELAPRSALWAAKQDMRRAGHALRDWAGWVLTGASNN